MAQVSRPFQIALAAVALLAGVWLFALRGHSQSSQPSASSAQTPAPPASASTHPSTSHGSSVPGLTGLTRDVNKAHEAVASSNANAAELQRKSEQASSPAAKATSGSAAAPSSHSAGTRTAPARRSSATRSASRSHHRAKSSPQPSVRDEAAADAARERAIAARLHSGGVVLVLFWDPRGSDDRAVYGALRGMGLRNASVYEAAPGSVASFGTITRDVQILQTPTLLVIGPSRQARVITGLTDPYAIGQAVSEARSSRH
jgi:hypothetical protein